MYASIKSSFERDGFAVLPHVLPSSVIAALIALLECPLPAGPAARGTDQVYAIRDLLRQVEGLEALLHHPTLVEVVDEVFGPGYFNVKGIYFDKPADYNWTVAWHQDLMISVDRRPDPMASAGLPGFSQWSLKSGQPAVRPPIQYSRNIRTLRIHLDDCDETNGALRVIPGTHHEGVLRYGPDLESRKTVTCPVPAGGAMLMSPLLMHSSHRSAGGRRRVIHLEFASLDLPGGLQWRERSGLCGSSVPSRQHNPKLYI